MPLIWFTLHVLDGDSNSPKDFFVATGDGDDDGYMSLWSLLDIGSIVFRRLPCCCSCCWWLIYSKLLEPCVLWCVNFVADDAGDNIADNRKAEQKMLDVVLKIRTTRKVIDIVMTIFKLFLLLFFYLFEWANSCGKTVNWVNSLLCHFQLSMIKNWHSDVEKIKKIKFY